MNLPTYVRFTQHFYERLFERVPKEQHKIVAVQAKRYVYDHCCELIYESVLTGDWCRFKIGKWTVCYRFDNHAKLLLITTVYCRPKDR